MNEENIDTPAVEEDLDTFAQELFSENKPEPKVENEPESEDVEDLAPEDDEDAEPSEDEEGENEENEPEEDEDSKPKPKKKQSFQERINEVYADKKAAERERDIYLRRIEALEAAAKEKTQEKVEPEPVPLREKLPSNAPNPDSVDDKGEPLYPLGEFDPQYISDLTRFTIQEETKRAREEAKINEEQEHFQKVQQEIAAGWGQKVEAAETEIPDLRDRIDNLTTTFAGIDGPYGDYLANLIMSSDVGPEMMSYFSDNIGEARKIVASGPAAATLALGRLEAKLTKSSSNQEQSERNKRVSKAPEPPSSRNKGNGSRFTVAGDTDDLDAFSREFFPKR